MALSTIKIKILKKKSLLAMAENAVKGGDNYFFRNLYADVDGVEKDILEDGSLSCAVFVSTILLSLELTKRPHATVDGVERDMLDFGWHEVKDLKIGSVIIWEKNQAEENIQHKHMGFYIGNNEAISNDSKGTGFLHKHHVTYNNTRKIEKIYWHPSLDED